MTDYVISLVNNGEQYLTHVSAQHVTEGENLTFYNYDDGEKVDVATFSLWAWYARRDGLGHDKSGNESPTDPENEPVLEGQQVSKGVWR